MDFDRLSEFISVVSCGSIKKAAALHSLSPSTLAARIQSLERTLNLQLFERPLHNLKTTKEGDYLFVNAKNLVARYQGMVSLTQSAQTHIYRSLRICICGGGSIPAAIEKFLIQLNRTFPEIDLFFFDDRHFSIKDGLLNNQIDLYFAPAMDGFCPIGLSKVQFGLPAHYILLPCFHRFASRTSILFSELCNEQFIMYPRTRESCLRDFLIHNLSSVKLCHTLYECDASPQFYKHLVAIGKGILITPHPVGDAIMQTVCIPVRNLPQPTFPTLFYNGRSPNPDVLPFVRDFTAFCKGDYQ